MKAKATVSIDVQYEDVEDLKAIHSALKFGVEYLAANGLLSSEDGPDVVTTWDYDIDVKEAE